MKCPPRHSECLALCVAERELTPEKMWICTPPGSELLTDRRFLQNHPQIIDANANARDCFLIQKNGLAEL